MALRVLSWKTLFILGLCQVGCRVLASAANNKDPPKKIAIIGGGIGGTAAAYFLRQEFGPTVKIEVFESGTVGGRLATENIGGYDYETGGCIIHPLNLHMKHFVERLGSAENFYEVNYVGESGAAHSMYDIVIVATPLHQGLSKINFSGFSPSIPSHFPGQYHQTVATLVHGLLNVSYLGVTQKPKDFVFSDVFTTDNKASVIQSLHSKDPVHIPKDYSRPPASQSKVWKIFSSESVPQEELKKIFISWDSVSEKRWLACPSYTPPHRGTPPFILHERLYYLNAIEGAASAMEMSAISARNLVLLAHHRWYQQTDKIDQEDLDIKIRGEL